MTVGFISDIWAKHNQMTSLHTNSDTRKLISIIIPVFNEQNNIEIAYKEVCSIFDSSLSIYDFEVVFTDNHSTDNTYSILERIAKSDHRIRVIRFTQNFGFNKSLLTGYRTSRGDAAIQLDCDLQDPPSLFPKMIAQWENGHDVVVGIRAEREESKLLQLGRKAFYRFLNRVSEDNLIIDGGDFRLVDRSILDKLNEIHDATPYVRGLISSIASNQTGIPYSRSARTRDKSKFPLKNLMSLAIDGIISHSTIPLRLASIAGFIIAGITTSVSFIYIIGKLAFGLNWPAGFATQIILILFGIGLNAIFLGIIGEYISRIYLQLKQKPITIIERQINLTPKNDNTNS